MSLKLKVYNRSAEKVKEVEVDSKIFSQEPNEELLHQVIVSQHANARQVIADTKVKSEVSGGGKKPWKQKGTGRARAGSSRSPIWRGGGVTFGPSSDRNFKKKVNQKMKQKVFAMIFSDKIAAERLVLIDDLKFSEYKTKDFADMLTNIEKKILKDERRQVLVINSDKEKKTFFSGRNLQGVKIINAENINIIDLLSYKNLIMDESFIKSVEEKYTK